jgi:hypothetical protein
MMELTESDIKRIVTEAVRAELVRALPVLFAMALDEWQRNDNRPRLSELDRDIAKTVSQIYRDTGKPARTVTVAAHMGYTRQHMLELCKAASDKGVIVKLPCKWGKFVPVAVQQQAA